MWSVDSQDWRITAGGQTEAGLLGNVTQWANTANTLTKGGNSLMHDLNNVTVGAALKALPILHPKVKLSPVGVCAGWKDASYLESPGAPGKQPSASNSVAPAASSGVAPAASGVHTPTAAKNNSNAPNSASGLVKNPIAIGIAAALSAFVAAF